MPGALMDDPWRTVHASPPHSPLGTSSPLGAMPCRDGVNFSVFSKHATGIDLLLFDDVDDAQAKRVIRIDPASNRTGHYWHVFVPGVMAGQIYGYRAEGPWDLAGGMRFDPTKLLLDPYGRGVVVPDGYSRDAASQAGAVVATAMKASWSIHPTTIGKATSRCSGHLRRLSSTKCMCVVLPAIPVPVSAERPVVRSPV
jgi:pullulanase/glycogen debranching enzyme